MIKIFYYELRRLLLNRFFAALLIITLYFSWRTLQDETILGVANTAPFSPWSIGSYLTHVLPLLIITLLFFISFLFSPQEKHVSVLTNATPTNPARYLLTRLTAILFGFLLLASAVFLLGYGFLWRLFGNISFISQLPPAMYVLIPIPLFFLGLGAFIIQIHSGFGYALMLITLLLSQIGLLGSRFFQEYPLTLGTLDPVFSVSGSFLLSRLALCAMGIILLILSLKRRLSTSKCSIPKIS